MNGERVPHDIKSTQNKNTSELAESAVFMRELWEYENLKAVLTSSILWIRKLEHKWNMDLHMNSSNLCPWYMFLSLSEPLFPCI